MTEKDHQHDLADTSEGLFAEIGRVAVDFALMEVKLEVGITYLLFGDQQRTTGAIVASFFSFRRKIDLFCALYRYRFPKVEQSPLRRFRKRMMDAANVRNVLVHMYAVSDGEEFYTARLDKRTFVSVGFSLTRTELERRRKSVSAAAVAATEFVDDLANRYSRRTRKT